MCELQPGKRLGVLAIIVSTLGFCVYPILGKFVFAGGANVVTVLFVRFGVASLVFWTLILLKDGRPKIKAQVWMFVLFAGGAGYGGMAGLYLYSVRFIPASLASLIFYSFPFMVTVISILTHQERLSRFKVLGLSSSSCGLVLVLGFNLAGINLAGALITFSAAAVHSFNVLAGNRIVKAMPPLVSTAIISSGAALACGSVGLVSGFTWDLSVVAWLGIGGITLFSSVIAMLCFYQGMRIVGASAASILSMLEPVMTGILAFLFLGERLSLLQGIGGALVIIGGAIVAWMPVTEQPSLLSYDSSGVKDENLVQHQG